MDNILSCLAQVRHNLDPCGPVSDDPHALSGQREVDVPLSAVHGLSRKSIQARYVWKFGMMQHPCRHDGDMSDVSLAIRGLDLPVIVGPGHAGYFAVEPNERADAVIIQNLFEIGLNLVAPDQIG